jgi:hypothetical protein
MAPAIDGQGASSQSGAYVKFASLRSAFDALGPAHQNAKHGHDSRARIITRRTSPSELSTGAVATSIISLSLGPPAVNKKKAPAKPGPVHRAD